MNAVLMIVIGFGISLAANHMQTGALRGVCFGLLVGAAYAVGKFGGAR